VNPPAMSTITVYEVGPRDGLQNESAQLETADKVAFIDALSAAGLPVIEIAAFVSPSWVPQMADADAVCRSIERRDGTRYVALVPNLKGLDRALDAGMNEVAVFAAASETFSRRNINQSIAQSLENYRAVAARAIGAGCRVRAYVSTAFGCPFEGDVPVAKVIDVTTALRDLGAGEVSVSDTIGVAHPGQVRRTLDALTRIVSPRGLALHFHDTRGTALANVLAALEFDITTFDASAGGLGGCPYAPGATGNLATEDLLYMLHGLGHSKGAALDAVSAASMALEPRLGHPLPSRYVQATRRSKFGI
jgi:hydroxymethylglutaryl-CoA lyase